MAKTISRPRRQRQLELFGLGEIESERKKQSELHLTAVPHVEIRLAPGEPKTTFRVSKDDFVDGKRSAYLLCGFDTEYQSYRFDQEDIRSGKAKYEVLSYQFYADNRQGYQWEGIAVPDTRQRLSLTEFLIFMLGAAAAAGQKLQRTIVMVGHYTRADLPAFSDRGQLWNHLNNVRNSLVSPSVPINVRIPFGADKDDDENTVELKVYVRDTMLLAPAGRKSLSQLGDMIGEQKIKLADNAEDELLLKQSMKAVREQDWPKFKQYALRDAKVSALYFERVAEQYRSLTENEFIPNSLSSIGVTLAKQDWISRDLDPLAMVGREELQEPYWDEKRGYLSIKRTTPYIEEFSWHSDFVSECYHGGRNEQLQFGPSEVDDWSDFDLTSAYPTAMATINKPLWSEIREMTAEDLDGLSIDTLAFATVEFWFPDSVRYPTLPIRTANGIIFPRRGVSYCASPELFLAKRLGCRLKLRRGVIIPTDASCSVFFPFIKKSIERRKTATTEIEEQFWKEIVNSCYGKTAQGLREKRAFGLRYKKSQRLPESPITNPAYAAHITSLVRAVLGEIMNAVPGHRSIFSVTTDGFITNATELEMVTATAGPLSQRFREAAQQLSGSDVLKVKHRARRVLGWKTRGQATILPGEDELVENTLLAKAGIRAPAWATELTEQNDWIVETFLSRTGATEIEMDVLTSVREMILYDADLVSKSATKRMPMEYDFKRRPSSVGETDVVLRDGRRFNHIVFDTEPFETVEEFRLTRDIWDAYRRSQEFCIRTLEDFQSFAEYMDRTRSLSDEAKTYLRKNDNDGLQRLRRDLCRAFKNSKAGFEFYGYISNKEFAEILNESGLKDSRGYVKISDVENGKRAAFQRNATVPTQQVLKVMQVLRSTFPMLRQDEFLGALPPDAAVWLNIRRT